MRYTAAAAILALASSVSAVGKAVVKNNCPSTFYLWSVGGSLGPKQTIAPGKSIHVLLSVAGLTKA